MSDDEVRLLVADEPNDDGTFLLFFIDGSGCTAKCGYVYEEHRAEVVEALTKPTLSTIIRDMRAHAVAFPSHGYNCACRDRQIREARALLSKEERGELFYLADVLRRTQ